MHRISFTDRFDKKNWLCFGLLIFFVALYSFTFRFSIPPFEDAAMLMRYAHHIADGQGIVWNIGEKPLDGATDFLFMVVLAAFAKAGMSLEFAVRFIGIISHIATVLIIFIATRKFYNANRWLAFVSALYFAVGPGLGYAEAGFGTSFFALAVSITWCAAIKTSEENHSRVTVSAFALLCFITGLSRPEGVFLSFLMLISVIYMKGLKKSLIPILYFVFVYGVFGGGYFIWRWDYFGDPLPNPFYIKGGGHFYLTGLRSSIAHSLLLLGPFTLAYILGFRSPEVIRKTVFSLIPITGFILLWCLMQNEMNYLMRYQYPVLAITLISFVPLVKNIPAEFKLPSIDGFSKGTRIVLYLSAIFMLASLTMYQHQRFSSRRYLADGIYDTAVMLSKYSHKNYTIATSEAGILPLYSYWRAIDTYGLNDQWIAHNGGITEEYLDKNKPELIMFRALFSPLAVQKPNDKTKNWFDMTVKLKSFAEKKGYILAASFGDTPYDTHNYYVRRDFPESEEITAKIRNINYYWDTGNKAINYAMFRTINN